MSYDSLKQERMLHIQVLEEENDKLRAEMDEMKSNLYSAKDSAEYWRKSAKLWQRWHNEISARADAWKALCGEWVEYAKRWRHWYWEEDDGSAVCPTDTPPEKPEGV